MHVIQAKRHIRDKKPLESIRALTQCKTILQEKHFEPHLAFLKREYSEALKSILELMSSEKDEARQLQLLEALKMLVGELCAIAACKALGFNVNNPEADFLFE